MVDIDFKPRFIVLLAAYNGLRWLDKQVDSILDQEKVDIELVISIDPSNDGTQDYFEKLALNDSRVKLLATKEKFGGAAPNFFRLIRDTNFERADYISFADQDDIWDLDKLYRAHKCLVEKGGEAYSSNVLAFWESGRKVLINKAQPQTRYDYLFESAGPGCTFVFSRRLGELIQEKILEDIDAINSVWLHDWFCYSFARFNGFSWVIDPRPSLLYRQHDNNQVGANSGWKSLLHRVSIILSGDGFNRVLTQAKVLDQNDVPPIEYISKGSKGAMIKLLFISCLCRRKYTDKFFFFCMSLIFLIRGRSLDE